MGTPVGATGAVAQLGERRLCKAEVRGSIPLGSTTLGWAATICEIGTGD